jgi:TetR/AcrR family transcriptional regulator, transcriptional repressor of bet genes
MRSKNSTGVQKPERSFIEEARRAQIIESAIDTLGELGYGQTSLAKIAKKAGVSTSLILYHFKDREDLVSEVLSKVIRSWNSYVAEKLEPVTDIREQLHTYIEASIAYMGTHPRMFIAMVDILFTARDKNGAPIYLTRRDPEHERYVETAYLEELFAKGQKDGVFKDFDVRLMAIMLRGCIDQFLGYMHAAGGEVQLEDYAAHLVKSIDRVVIKEGR